MYCPKCSQQQVSDKMRFCSRCGFPLNVVVDLLANDGAAPAALDLKVEQPLSPRQKGIRQGTLLVFASVVASFIAALLSIFVLGRPELFVPLIGGAIFLCGVLRIVYAYIFEPAAEVTGKRLFETAQLSETAGNYLPPPQSIPITGLGAERATTAEMVLPPSVTEHTTKQLREE